MGSNVRLEFPPNETVSLDIEAFDTALVSQGIKLSHWKGMRCPVGLSDKWDNRRPHDDHTGCSNGFIFTYSGTVTALISSVSHNSRQQDVGLLDGSTVTVTCPRFYDDNARPVEILNFDRMYMSGNDITVEHWELATASAIGRDKLRFPIVSVVDVMDSTGRRYTANDYRVDDGVLVWTTGGPGFDPRLDKGVVYSIRYRLTPYWYVQRLIHEVRVAQVETALERAAMRFPVQFSMSREYVFERADNDEMGAQDPTDPNSHLRQVKPPQDGPYGAR